MGRIEDAVRRAAAEAGRAVEPVPEAHDPLPWAFDREEEPERAAPPQAQPPQAQPLQAQPPQAQRPQAIQRQIQPPPVQPPQAEPRQALQPRPRAETTGAERPRPAETRAEPEPPRAASRLLGDEGPLAVFRGFDGAIRERLVVSQRVPPMLVEQFRRLAATLLHAQIEQKLKTVLVTSASVGDGKSLTAINLALTLSESYQRRVLLVDADLRRPTLHDVFHTPNAGGLNEGLKAKADEKLTLIQITERLTLLPAGQPVSDPVGGLSSGRMKRILEEAAARFEWVILDTPPAGVLADAHILSGLVDGTLLVVRAGVTPFEEAEAAIEGIGRERILGIVFNAVDPANLQSKSYYYKQYYGPREG